MHYAEYKTILSAKNNMNIYRGCTHGCIYCDSRSNCYQMKHDFCDIEVKSNAPIMLDKELKSKRKRCMISTGAMTDPYIHIEEQLEYTKKCLEVIHKHGFGATVLTKSTRILRDIDIIKKINDNTKFVVQMTLTTYDEELCKKLEPHVSTTKERAMALNTFRDLGVPCVVWFGPFLPFINDTEENLIGLLNYCVEAKVKGIVCFGFGVTMRDGNREYFYNELDKSFKGKKEEYIKAFGNSYGCNSPNYKNLMKIFKETCEKENILYKINDVFEYLQKFEEKDGQLSLF